MKSKPTKKLLIALLAFLGIGAIGGGEVLIASPEGELIGMPLTLIKDSPFESFLIPGIAPMLLIIA